MSEIWFESFTLGQTFRSGGKTLSEAEILDFAFRYDPQPIHIDKPAAEAGPYGGLISSGWQTMAVAFRMFMELKPFGQASLGSPGVDELRWLKPVRPGDTIRMEAEVVEIRPSASRPDRGGVTVAYRVLNQKDETVMTLKAVQLLRRRPA
jgi:acyl dehydratase